MYIKVKVTAGAKKEMIIKKSEDHFDISVKEPAERNLANKRVIELVRDYFKVYNPVRGKKLSVSARSTPFESGPLTGYNKEVRIVSGHHSPSKIISLDIKK